MPHDDTYDYSGIDIERLLRPASFMGWLSVCLGFYTAVFTIVGLPLVTSASFPLDALVLYGLCGAYVELLAFASLILAATWVCETRSPGSINRSAILFFSVAPCALALPLCPGLAFTLSAVAVASGLVIPLPRRPLHDDWYEAAGASRPTGPTLGELLLTRLRST